MTDARREPSAPHCDPLATLQTVELHIQTGQRRHRPDFKPADPPALLGFQKPAAICPEDTG